LEATSERELRRLRQTTSMSDYAAKFESLKQYLSWNDAALRDQFYLNLRDDVKDELAPLDRPQTLSALKELATRLDSRLEERRREHRHLSYPPSNSCGPNRPQPPSQPPVTPSTPLPALRTPSHTADGTVCMELDATGTCASQRAKRNVAASWACVTIVGERDTPYLSVLSALLIRDSQHAGHSYPSSLRRRKKKAPRSDLRALPG